MKYLIIYPILITWYVFLLLLIFICYTSYVVWNLQLPPKEVFDKEMLSWKFAKDLFEKIVEL